MTIWTAGHYLCGKCADEAWDRWLDRHDDIGPED